MNAVSLAVTVLSVLVFVSSIFGVYVKTRRLDIADIAWGGIFIVAALASFLIGERGVLQIVTTLLVCIWGCRLSYHIFRRHIKTPEDARYVEMRKRWKGNELVNAYLRIFLSQGILGLVIAFVVIAINLSDVSNINIFTYVGISVWLIGFMFEAIGDKQLKDHIAEPRNKGTVMSSGLWRYTRHPNYFGESVQWWGIWIIALGVPYGWVTIISPLLITYLLLFVSGVPLAEKRLQQRKGWNVYQKRTSVFLPLPPKKVQ